MLVRMARLAGKMKAATTPISARVEISVPVGSAGRRCRGREEPRRRQSRSCLPVEGAPAPEPVADAAAEQKQPGEGQAVGVDNPLQ